MKLLAILITALSFVSANAQSTKTKLPASKSSKRAPAQAPVVNTQSVAQANFAAETKMSATASNFFFQPNESVAVFELKPFQSTVENSIKSKLSQTSQTSSSTEKVSATELVYRRGLSENKAFAISTSIGSSEITPGQANEKSYKNAGFSDFKFELSKLNQRESDEQILGGVLTFSPGSSEAGYDYSAPGQKLQADGNRYTGGHSIAGFYGVQKQANTGRVYGSKITGKLQLQTESSTRNSDNVKSTTTSDGGHSLAGEVFTESKQGPVTLGVTGGLAIVTPTDYSTSGSGEKFSFTISQRTYFNLNAYGVIETSNKKINILPTIGFTKLMTETAGKVNLQNNDTVTLALLARFSL